MLQLEWDSNLKPSGRKAQNPTIEPLRPTFSRLTRRNTYYLKVANNDVEIRNVLQYGNCTQYLSTISLADRKIQPAAGPDPRTADGPGEGNQGSRRHVI